MDLHLHVGSLAEQVRLQHIDGRVDAAGPDELDRDHHRNALLQEIAIIVLLVLSAIGGLLLLSA